MEIRMTSNRVNPLIGRRELIFEIVNEVTPSRERVRSELAAALKVDMERVWIRRLKTNAGTHRTVGLAHVYENGGRAPLIEPKYIIQRNKPEMRGEEEN